MAAAILPLITTAVFARACPKQKPLVGFEIGPKTNEIAAKQFIIDLPTIENLGFRWYFEGDNNRNAKVAIAFRKKGQKQRKNVNVVDAGTTLPQITDGSAGEAPDLGCYELGQEPPHYGPRQF